jgi:hypothetical protein
LNDVIATPHVADQSDVVPAAESGDNHHKVVYSPLWMSDGGQSIASRPDIIPDNQLPVNV